MDTPQIQRELSGDTTRPDLTGSKVHLRTLNDLDGRTAASRRARELVANYESDLGGADRLTTGQRELVKRVALAGALAEDIEVRWLQGGQIDVGEYATLVNTQRRLCVTVGLERRARDVTPDLTAEIMQALG